MSRDHFIEINHFLFLLALIFANPARAVDWFVAVNGNDSLTASGSINAPFASINRAFWPGYAGPGDTIYVRGGTYPLAQGQRISAGGTAQTPITIRPYPNETVILDGSGLPTSEPAVLTVLASHVIVEGFNVRNSTGIGIQIWPDSTPVENVVIRNNTIRDCQKSGLFVGHKLDQTTAGVSGIQILDNILQHNVLENQARVWLSDWHPTLGILYSQDIVVRGNQVHENYGEGISLMQSRRISVTRNVVRDNYSVNLYIDGSIQTRHEGNLVYSTGQQAYFRDFYRTPSRPSLPASGIQIANESWSDWTNPLTASDNTIVNNIFVGNRAALVYGNYQSGGGLNNVLFAFNTSYNHVETALQIDPDVHANNEIANNIWVQLGGKPLTWLGGGASGFQFHHNLWFGGYLEPAPRSATDVNADPAFIRPGGYSSGDYALQAGSPALAAGQTLAEISRDYTNKLRLASPALGALESWQDASDTLIDHYYRAILGRTPDAGGKAYWGNEAIRMRDLEVDVREAFRVMAGSFFASPEYLTKQTSSAKYVTDLYRTFFNREPDSGGLYFWIDQLTQGMPRGLVLNAFLFSSEFATYMQDVLGDSNSRGEIYAVIDFYRGTLNRLPDSAGFTYWLNRFRTAQCQSASAITLEVDIISRQFLASAEYISRNRNNSDYISDLYYTFLRRGAESDGFNYWRNQLDKGLLSHEQVRAAFIQSPEFQARIQKIIDQGCLA